MTEDERRQQLEMDFKREIQNGAIEQEMMVSRAFDRLVREQRVSTRPEAERLAGVIYYGWKMHNKLKATAGHSRAGGPAPPAHPGARVARRANTRSVFHPRNHLAQFAWRLNLGMTPETAIPHGTVRWLAPERTKVTRKHQLTIQEALRAGCMLRAKDARRRGGVWRFVAASPVEHLPEVAAQDRKFVPGTGLTSERPIPYEMLPNSVQKRVEQGQITMLLLSKEEADEMGVKICTTSLTDGTWRHVAPGSMEAVEAMRRLREMRGLGMTPDNPIPHGMIPRFTGVRAKAVKEYRLNRKEAEAAGVDLSSYQEVTIWCYVAPPPSKDVAVEGDSVEEETAEAAQEREIDATFGWTPENPVPYGKVPGLAEENTRKLRRHQLTFRKAREAGMMLDKTSRGGVFAWIAPRPISRAEAANEHERWGIPGMTAEEPIPYGLLPAAEQKRVVPGRLHQIRKRDAEEAGIDFDDDASRNGVWRYVATRPAEGDSVEDAKMHAAIGEFPSQP